MVHAQKKEQTHKKSLKMKKKVKMNSVNLCTNALFCNRGTWEIVHTIINYEFIQTMAKKKEGGDEGGGGRNNRRFVWRLQFSNLHEAKQRGAARVKKTPLFIFASPRI